MGQRGLLAPGLALLALSERAWTKAEKNSADCFYFNLPAERRKLAGNETHFTSPVNLIAGLDASLDLLLAHGLEAVYKKQWALTMLARTGAQAMGLALFAPDNYAWGLTSVEMPEGVDAQKVLEVAQKEYNICMAGGQDRLKGRIIRIGHMGWVDWADILAGLYALNRGLLNAGGFTASRDYLEQAMSAYRAALNVKPGEPISPAALRS